jgi:tetratricopeptide (TPR) repeat protein
VVAEARGKLLPLEALRTILLRAGGNPLFLKEVTKALLDTEPVVLVERDTTWELVGTLPSQAVPGTVEAALVSRLDRLGDDLSTLQLAATVGDPFSAEILQAVQPLDGALLRDRLGRLVAADLIAGDPLQPSLFHFRHALIQDTAYGMMLLRERRRYHGSLARLLQRQENEGAVVRPERVAHHLFHAGNHGAAATAWLAAGNLATERGALSEANEHFGHALGALERLPESEERRCQERGVLKRRAPVLMAIHGWASPLVAEACGRSLELLEQDGQSVEAFWPRFGLWAHQFVKGDLDVALGSAEEIRDRADRCDRQALRLAACNALSYTHCYRAEFEAAILAADRGLAIADPTLDQEVLSHFQLAPSIPILAARGKALWMRGRRAEGCRVIDSGVPYADSLEHLPSLAVALSTQVDLCGWMGDWQRLEERAAVLIELARSQGFTIWRTYGEMMLARARMERSEDTAASEDLLRWSSLLKQTGTGFEVTTTAAMVGEALRRRGETAQALAVNRAAEEQARRRGVAVMLPELLRLRAELEEEVGDAGGAAFSRNRAARLARDQGALSLQVRVLTDSLRHGGADAPGLLAEELAAVVENVEATPACTDLIAAREGLARTPGPPFPAS